MTESIVSTVEDILIIGHSSEYILCRIHHSKIFVPHLVSVLVCKGRTDDLFRRRACFNKGDRTRSHPFA